jgi:hypothetical protein
MKYFAPALVVATSFCLMASQAQADRLIYQVAGQFADDVQGFLDPVPAEFAAATGLNFMLEMQFDNGQQPASFSRGIVFDSETYFPSDWMFSLQDSSGQTVPQADAASQPTVLPSMIRESGILSVEDTIGLTTLALDVDLDNGYAAGLGVTFQQDSGFVFSALSPFDLEQVFVGGQAFIENSEAAAFIDVNQATLTSVLSRGDSVVEKPNAIPTPTAIGAGLVLLLGLTTRRSARA